MKITKKRVLFFLLHLFFSAIVPIGLIIFQYSTIGEGKAEAGFALSITGILFLIFVFWLIKKIFIDRYLIDLRAQNTLMIANLKTEPDPVKLKALEREVKNIRTMETIFSSIIPLLFIVATIVAFKALEAQLIKLSATLGWIALSFTTGIVFNVLYARQVKGKGGNND